MMVQLAPESARASKTIKQAYRAHLDLLVLEQFAELQGALANGGLAPLPSDPVRFNVTPRLSGPSPIGEKDLGNQVSYIAARPATIGALLDVASRVTSGPIEVTSLVRHSEYQSALRATNANATTSVPMHTMGLAFDISLINTPLETVYEIRDVLRRMQAVGEILFIGERKQLVFHVVPHPSRLGHFTDVYAQAIGGSTISGGTPVVAFASQPGLARQGRPSVSAEVIAILPTGEFAEEWWAVDDTHADLAVSVAPDASTPLPDMATDRGLSARDVVARLLVLFAVLIGLTWWALSRPPSFSGLFEQSA